jgi:hypothetical protein
MGDNTQKTETCGEIAIIMSSHALAARVSYLRHLEPFFFPVSFRADRTKRR